MLRFQTRVLEKAFDAGNPLLERVRFLAIVGTNVDEFLMVRGAEARRHAAKRLVIDQAVNGLLEAAYACARQRLHPELTAAGIRLREYGDLTDDERAEVLERSRPLFPLIRIDEVAAAGAFPTLPGSGLSFAVTAGGGLDDRLFVVSIPAGTPSLIAAGETGAAYAWLHDVVRENLAALLPGTVIRTVHAFRILRAAGGANAASPDPISAALGVARARARNSVVALFVDRAMPQPVTARLARGLNVVPEDVHQLRQVIDLPRYWQVSRLTRPDLQYPAFPGRVDTEMQEGRDLFAAIRARDVLMHHPYDSFEPVVEWLRRAAADPAVESISAALYRTDRESRVVETLAEAARRGKCVSVLVELKARFDEERNVVWCRVLTDAGARVTHLPGHIKMHAKVAIVSRREGPELRHYGHLSSGNYNEYTSTAYTDVGLFTCHPDITSDLVQLFGLLTDGVPSRGMRTLLVAPSGLRDGFRRLVEREIGWAQDGRPAHIILKMNGLRDREVIHLLYRASQAGVRVDLIVRGVCALRPGLPGVSDHITVRSIVGRFLEHSRAWYFRNGGAEDVYIGSADLMPRNLDRRVDVMAPLLDGSLRQRVLDEILRLQLADTANAHTLAADGTYSPAARRGATPLDAQAVLLERH